MKDSLTDFTEKLRKTSVVKECPRCGNLTLMYAGKKIICTHCGFEEDLPEFS
ncbi:hypothetical protein HYW21_03945 [Candidatus Woesearchaeota archaeon]|nr:hypothetical protein [Candidatus Woesearchaeota archaeon]